MSNVVLERSAETSTVGTKRRVPIRRTLLLASVIAVAAAGVWYGERWWRQGRFIESTDDAYVGGDITPISPHISGFVASVVVSDNQHVQAGQALLRLDDRDMRAAFQHAQAVLEERRAALASLQARTVLQRSTVSQARAELDVRRAQASFAQLDASRYRGLALSSAGSRQDAQRTAALDLQAKATVQAAESALAAADQQLDVLAADTLQAAAAVTQAQADLQAARLNLGYATIRSPIEGYVGNRAAQVGSYVSAGTYLVTIVPAHGLWIDANFKEDQLAAIRPGMPASVVTDIRPGHLIHGRVVSLAPGAGAVFSVIPPENATGNFTKIVQRVPVRIALDPDDGALGVVRPGLSATVSVDTKSAVRSQREGT